MCVFFTLTDRASTISSNTCIRGWQSGTWSAGQEKIRGISSKLKWENKSKTKGKNDKKKENRKKKKKKMFFFVSLHSDLY